MIYHIALALANTPPRDRGVNCISLIILRLLNQGESGEIYRVLSHQTMS